MAKAKDNISYFLALIPDDKANFAIRRIVADVGALFDSHGIRISLSKPESFRISVINFGKTLPFFKKFQYGKKINKHFANSNTQGYQIELDRIRLGISRNYRELLFLTLDGGAEQLRNLVYELTPKLGLKRDYMFIPHLTLGRVGKDLTNEEFKNLNESIFQLNNRLKKELHEISFQADSLQLIKSTNGVYELLNSFPITSSAS